jgi:hypothetical protein
MKLVQFALKNVGNRGSQGEGRGFCFAETECSIPRKCWPKPVD